MNKASLCDSRPAVVQVSDSDARASALELGLRYDRVGRKLDVVLEPELERAVVLATSRLGLGACLDRLKLDDLCVMNDRNQRLVRQQLSTSAGKARTKSSLTAKTLSSCEHCQERVSEALSDGRSGPRERTFK